MPHRPDPYQRLRLRAWDQAAGLAARGTPAADIPGQVIAALAADIDAVSEGAVPAHGRSFWISLAKSMSWGVTVVVLLFLFGPSGGGLPLLRPVLVAAVLVWAVGFGMFAANHKVRIARARAAATARAVVDRTSVLALAGNDTAWSRRLGARPGELDGFVVDGSLTSVRTVLRAPRPVALFVREPGVFSDDARFAADRYGLALFVLSGADLVPMSGLATDALDALDPLRELRRGWHAAAAVRDGDRPGQKK